MARKKPASKKKTAGRKKITPKKNPARKKKPALRKKKPAAKPARRKKKTARGTQETTNRVAIRSGRGMGPASAGQSGDTQQLSRREDVDSESVEGLEEEGQYFEAEAVSGVENAKDPDQGEVTTSEVPEDDVPPEYLDRD
ncbi:MAG TPA: hypothetical protein VI488_09135 [Candidatus Angelobacter sp.]